MSSFKIFKFLLLTAFLILQKPATAQNDSTGFHGYERDALLALKDGFNNSFLDRNWTGIMCYMDEVPYWYGIQCLSGRVTGLILEDMELTGEIKENSMVNLTELSTVNLRNNSISGNLMNFAENQNLRIIDLSGNNFHGNIPISLLDLNSLESLQLQNNNLTGKKNTRERIPFRWNARLSIARGVARALEHLHQNTRSQTTAPHGNLKSTNVLLDENEEPLVTDYGLSSLIAIPIAAQRMVSGQIPSHSAPHGTGGVELCSWVHRAVREEWTAEIFDPEIAVQRGANQGMLRLMQIAMRCCEKLPEKRPEIGLVVAEVEAIKVVVTDSEEDGDYSYTSSYDRSITATDDSNSATAVSVASDRR